jgi:hypothetical protein
MNSVGILKARRNSEFERRKIRIIDRVETLLFDEFPKALNQVQVWGVSSQI